jgi:ankyrin repeat protein
MRRRVARWSAQPQRSPVDGHRVRTMVDREGRSELHYAALGNDVERIRSLIADGADVNLADTKGYTPLHFAAQEQANEAAEVLLAEGAEVDPVDQWGNTPLSRATFSSRGQGGLIRLLREHGAEVTKLNNYGVSPLGLARTIANYPVAQFYDDLP